MNVSKRVCSLSGKYTNLIRCYGKFSRTFCVTKGKKCNVLNRCIPRETAVGITTPLNHLQCSLVHGYSTQAPETKPISCPNAVINFRPLKFEDMSFEQKVPHEDLIKELMKCKNVGEQMETLASTLALSPEDIQNRVKFCKALETFFQPFFHKFRIQMFGSTVNCYGFKGCDIDMNFETLNTQEEKIPYLERPDVPLVGEVLCGNISPQEVSNLPPKEQLLFIHTLFLEFYKDSKDAPIFINAHVPIVRFHHDKFNLKCDLSFKNRVAFANTKLLYFYAKIDKRMVPLMMTLRYWAKHVELVGKGLMFNTYTVTLMLIHYLQTRDPPILPSAEYVKNLSGSFENDDMNDKSFLEIMDKIPPSKNTESLEEVLRGFFFYYLHFDFTRVICPLIGTSISREEFFSGDKNPKFRMNSICVQDPMCVSHNVAELVDYKHCKKLFHELMIACKIFQDNLTVPSSGAWGLMAILDKPEEYFYENVVVQKLVSFTVPLMSKTIEGKTIPDEKRAQITAETVLKILKHSLLFQCNQVEENAIQDLLKHQDELTAKQKKFLDTLTAAKLQSSRIMCILRKSSKSDSSKHSKLEESKLEQFQKFSSKHKLILCSECRVSKNTWLGRDFANLNNAVNTSLNILDREHLISVSAAKHNKENVLEKNTKPFVFLFECYISSNTPETSIVINFRPLQRMSFNPILSIFLQEYIPKIIKKIDNHT